MRDLLASLVDRSRDAAPARAQTLQRRRPSLFEPPAAAPGLDGPRLSTPRTGVAEASDGLATADAEVAPVPSPRARDVPPSRWTRISDHSHSDRTLAPDAVTVRPERQITHTSFDETPVRASRVIPPIETIVERVSRPAPREPRVTASERLSPSLASADRDATRATATAGTAAAETAVARAVALDETTAAANAARSAAAHASAARAAAATALTTAARASRAMHRDARHDVDARDAAAARLMRGSTRAVVPPPSAASRADVRRGDQRQPASAREMAVASAPPAIHVTIGRIDVRATPAPSGSRAARPRTPALGLDDYLQQRNGGGR